MFFIVEHTHIRAKCCTHNYKSFFGEKSSKKTKQNKNKTKTPQNHRRPATASVMQSQLEGSLHWQKNSDPKEGFPDAGCSPSLQPLRPEVRPLCTSGVVVAWLLRRTVFGRLSPVWLPKTILMNLHQQNPTAFQDLSRQKLSKILTFYYFQSSFLSTHAPEAEKSTNPICRSDFWPWI